MPYQFNAWKGVMPSHNAGRYYDQITCFYALAIGNLSEGLHSIKVAIRPCNVRWDYYKNGQEPIVNFAISKQSTTPPKSSPPEIGAQQLEFNSIIAAAIATTAVALIISILFFYFKKCNANLKNKKKSLDWVGSADLAERNLRLHVALAVRALLAFGLVVEHVARLAEDFPEMLVVK